MERRFKELEKIFHPKSVVIIGASENISHFIEPLIDSGLRVNLVNPKRKELFNQKCYASVLEIEDPIDHAIIAVPARLTPAVLKECIKKGVKAAHIFTAGFSEIGKEGEELERELEKISKGKIRLIGPNCMGIYCPESSLSFARDQPKESGPVGFISQSGGQAVNFIYKGIRRNFRFSKVISYGNGIDLDCPDFIEYLGKDPKTKVIAVYIEGVKRGRDLLLVLKKFSSKKPIIVLKGGVTREGVKAVSSHTGSLAGSREVWGALFRQTGVVPAKSFDELSDFVVAFLYSPLPKGKGIAVTTTSGGAGVVEADGVAEAGLELPALGQRTAERLREMIPVAGTSIKNPLDIWPAYARGFLPEVIKIVASDENIHSIILEIQIEEFHAYAQVPKDVVKGYLDAAIDVCKYVRDQMKKPAMIAIPQSYFSDTEREIREYFQNQRIPVYQSIRGAAKSIYNLYKYQEFLKTH